MNDRYLNSVFKSLIKSTRFDHNKAEIYTPFSEGVTIPSYKSFKNYCERVFGLNHSETVNIYYEYLEYVRDEIYK